MKKHDELKPCPCCGGEAETDWLFQAGGGPVGVRGYWVFCTVCKLRTNIQESEREAIASWNRRPK